MTEKPKEVKQFCDKPDDPGMLKWDHQDTMNALERFKRSNPDLYRRVRGKEAGNAKN